MFVQDPDFFDFSIKPPGYDLTDQPFIPASNCDASAVLWDEYNDLKSQEESGLTFDALLDSFTNSTHPFMTKIEDVSSGVRVESNALSPLATGYNEVSHKPDFYFHYDYL
jgi:hypothetical protein